MYHTMDSCLKNSYMQFYKLCHLDESGQDILHIYADETM